MAKRAKQKPDPSPQDGDLMRRAYAAWLRTGGSLQPGVMTEVVDHDGLQYVVLRGGAGPGPLAVYRVRNDDMLKRLKRWPEALN